jgi:hypothetical protein
LRSGWAALPWFLTCNLIFRLSNDLWLAVDEVVHHDDVMLAIVIRPRGNVAGRNPNRRDAGVIKLDAEEGQASIAR